MDAGYADEPDLVEALRRGDEGAFGWLLDRYDQPLRRLARSFVATTGTVDEVVQETWLAVIEGIDRFEQRSSVKTWIYRILMNKARTRGVRDKRVVPFSSMMDPTFPPTRFLPAEDPEWPGHWAVPPTPWDELPSARLESKETLARVQAAIADLPQPHREVITLRDIEGWTSDEVGALLDLTPANQRVVLHRARAKVRATLETYLTGVAI
ncbi:MAG TPA: RNA polymerase sigma factor [Acidimicrobiales bacterium]